jgi:hypothetical protein
VLGFAPQEGGVIWHQRPSRAKLGTHYTDPDTAAKALSMMLEGMSVRAISRITGLHKDTILAFWR